ncbi:MAG TPA: lipopolysaccharide biosynthesis protein [Stellaceae bacterium]|nr:lipopolysaccharide biosynthesis protein [Stellaceae bacterium]
MAGDTARRFARNSAFGTIAGIGTALASFLTSVLTAHLLGVTDTGVFAYAAWVATVTGAVADLGAQATLARYLPELLGAGTSDEADAVIAFLFRPVAAACAAVVASFSIYAAWRIGSGDIGEVLWIFVGVFSALQTMSGLAYGCLRGMQRFERVATLTVVSLSLQLVGVAVGAKTFGVTGALAGACAGSVLPAIVACGLVRRSPPFRPALKSRVRWYAVCAWGAGLASAVVWSRIEIFFLQRAGGSEAVGLFSVGLTLANLATQGPLLLTAGLLPYFAEAFGRGAPSDIRAAYATSCRVLALLVLPACLGMAAIMPEALPLVFGNAFRDAIPAASVLVAAGGICAAMSAGTYLVYAMDRSDFVFASGAVGAVLSIAAGLTVVPAYGLMGAAGSRAAIQLFAVALGCGFIVFRLRCPIPFADLGRLLLAAAFCGIVARLVTIVLPHSLALTGGIAAGVIAYMAAVRVLQPLPPADVGRLRALLRNLPAAPPRVLELALSLVFGAPRRGLEPADAD